MDYTLIISFITLTFMEIVLGIDNIIFISIVSDKLPKHQQGRARTIGLLLALIMRVILLLAITWIVQASAPLFTLGEFDLSIRDLILMMGGLFLLGKSTSEIHEKLEGEHGDKETRGASSLKKVIIQIILLDIVFSFDSILTAIGLVDQVSIMIAAIVISIGIMLAFAAKISNFVNKHPSVKMLALSFLLLIGFMLVLEGFHYEIPKGYIYFAIFFSLFVELLNMKVRKPQEPVKLKNPDYDEFGDK